MRGECACAAAICPFDRSCLHAEVAAACPINLNHHEEQVSCPLVPLHASLRSGTPQPGGPFPRVLPSFEPAFAGQVSPHGIRLGRSLSRHLPKIETLVKLVGKSEAKRS